MRFCLVGCRGVTLCVLTGLPVVQGLQRVCRERDDAGAVCGRVRGHDASCGLQAVHQWHVNVHQNDVIALHVIQSITTHTHTHTHVSLHTQVMRGHRRLQ